MRTSSIVAVAALLVAVAVAEPILARDAKIAKKQTYGPYSPSPSTESTTTITQEITLTMTLGTSASSALPVHTPPSCNWTFPVSIFPTGTGSGSAASSPATASSSTVPSAGTGPWPIYTNLTTRSTTTIEITSFITIRTLTTASLTFTSLPRTGNYSFPGTGLCTGSPINSTTQTFPTYTPTGASSSPISYTNSSSISISTFSRIWGSGTGYSPTPYGTGNIHTSLSPNSTIGSAATGSGIITGVTPTSITVTNFETMPTILPNPATSGFQTITTAPGLPSYSHSLGTNTPFAYPTTSYGWSGPSSYSAYENGPPNYGGHGGHIEGWFGGWGW